MKRLNNTKKINSSKWVEKELDKLEEERLNDIFNVNIENVEDISTEVTKYLKLPCEIRLYDGFKHFLKDEDEFDNKKFAIEIHEKFIQPAVCLLNSWHQFTRDESVNKISILNLRKEEKEIIANSIKASMEDKYEKIVKKIEELSIGIIENLTDCFAEIRNGFNNIKDNINTYKEDVLQHRVIYIKRLNIQIENLKIQLKIARNEKPINDLQNSAEITWMKLGKILEQMKN